MSKNTQVGKRGRSRVKGMIELESVMGTRDVYPEDMAKRRWLFDKWHAVARQFAFCEYDAPILESQELYTRKGGEEITSQMYAFETPEKEKLTLRPEMTPSLARLYLKRYKKLKLPLKWYAVPQCWRFESTTIGRKREHYQWNMDIVGIASVTAEAELLAALVTFLKAVGLSANDVHIKVNSRKVLEAVLKPLLPDESLFTPVCILLDKMDKLGKDDVTAQLRALNTGFTENVLNVLYKTLSLTTLDALQTHLTALNIPTTAMTELQQLWALAKAYGFADWLQLDTSVVRGLSYYTGIVFEVFDTAGEFRAIAGGGRYDRLLSQYGAKQDVPFCGFALGDCVVMRLLERKHLLPKQLGHTRPRIDYVILPFDASLHEAAFHVAAKLRRRGYTVDISLKKQRLKRAYRYADRLDAEHVVLVAPQEWAQGYVRVKALRKEDNEEQNVLVSAL